MQDTMQMAEEIARIWSLRENANLTDAERRIIAQDIIDVADEDNISLDHAARLLAKRVGAHNLRSYVNVLKIKG